MRHAHASDASSPPPRHAPCIAATTGVRRFSRRSSSACPSRLADSAWAAVFHSRNSSISAPAMNVSGFPLMSTAARTDVSASSCWKSAMNSFLTEREMMLTDSPGGSKTTIPMPSSTVSLSALIERMWDVGCERTRLPIPAVFRFFRGISPTSHIPHPRSRSSFDYHCKPEPSGSADGHQPELPSSPRELVGECHRYARSGGAERVAGGNAPAHHVEPCAVHLAHRLAETRARRPLVRVEPAKVGEHLRREGLVHLHQVDVLQ